MGLVKSFQLTFELSWKALKDYLEEMGMPLKFPREVLKTAFQSDIIEDSTLWIEMLESNTYEIQIPKTVSKIREAYFPALNKLYQFFQKADFLAKTN